MLLPKCIRIWRFKSWELLQASGHLWESHRFLLRGFPYCPRSKCPQVTTLGKPRGLQTKDTQGLGENQWAILSFPHRGAQLLLVQMGCSNWTQTGIKSLIWKPPHMQTMVFSRTSVLPLRTYGWHLVHWNTARSPDSVLREHKRLPPLHLHSKVKTSGFL